MLPPAGKRLTGCVCRPDGEKQGTALPFTLANVSNLFQSDKAGSGLLAQGGQKRPNPATCRTASGDETQEGSWRICGCVAARNFITERDAIPCPTDARSRRVTGREKTERCRNPSERTDIKRLMPYSRLPEPHRSQILNTLVNISQPVGKYFSTRWEIFTNPLGIRKAYGKCRASVPLAAVERVRIQGKR